MWAPLPLLQVAAGTLCPAAGHFFPNCPSWQKKSHCSTGLASWKALRCWDQCGDWPWSSLSLSCVPVSSGVMVVVSGVLLERQAGLQVLLVG